MEVEVPARVTSALPTQQPASYRSRRSRAELGLHEITFDPQLESIEEALSNPSHISHNRGSCGRLFRQSWWNPRFYSRPLEKQLQKKAIEFLKNRYRATEVWLSLFALLWIVFFSIQIPLSDIEGIATTRRGYSWEMIVGGVVFLLCVVTLLILSLTKIYKRFPVSLSLALCLLLMAASWLLVPSILIQVAQPSQYSSLSLINQFTISAIVILVIYTLSHKPILYCISLGIVYAVVLETLVVIFAYGMLDEGSGPSVQTELIAKMTAGRLCLHVCLNIVGFSTANWFQVRLHQTFWKVAHCLILQKALTLDRQLQEKTIASLMPPELAKELGEKFNEHAMFNVRSKLKDDGVDEQEETIVRPLTVHHTDNVSILFADIVGFTPLSSNMSAEELVGILNEIFSTFDELVSEHGCEKVCTLGDCYFCVSGCPQPCADHAANAVNMGLSIIEALREYSESHSLEISMRVGIHTGSVYYGVMGSQRFRFDVWSKDVNIANQIESAGVAGKVLLSETTQRQLSGAYLLEEFPKSDLSASLPDMKYFVVQGKRHTHQGSGASWRKKIRNIDVQVVADTAATEPAAGTTSHSTETPARHPLLCSSCCSSAESQSTNGHATMTRTLSSNSIMDIFSRQNQLDRCASLAEVNHPFTNHQSTVVTEIMELMEERDVNFDTFFRTSLHPITLLFDDEGLEKTYRNCGRDLGDCTAGRNPESEFGFVVAKMSYFVDVLLSVIVLFLVSFASLLTISSEPLEYTFWGIFFGMGVVIELPILFVVMSATWPKCFPRCFKWFSEKILNWKVKTVVGLLMIYYPMVLVYVGLVGCQSNGANTLQTVMRTEMSFYIAMTVLVASVLFMDVSFIAKVIAAVPNIIAVEVLAATVHVDLCYTGSTSSSGNFSAPVGPTASGYPVHPTVAVEDDIDTYFLRFVVPLTTIFSFLLAILLATVNRKSEISVRMSFKGRVEAVLQQQEMKQHRDQATWLIHHLIPTHVINDLRLQGKYSQNHACVGVIFATIVNVSEFYELECEHAIDCMRVLNDIVAGFDELLDRKEFAGVNKIKTIGASTYMAASGLDFNKDDNQSQGHLVNLINFSMEMLTFIQYVNQSLPFDFKLRIGFNYGPATSGVVGRSKLLFDIWGDTVNIASRMDTTGQVNRIHLPEECSSHLINYFSFEPCGETVVKGKGIMPTMLVKGRKRQFIRFEVLPEEDV